MDPELRSLEDLVVELSPGDSALTETQGRGGALAPAFWSGRRVLVTGHTGFKGAWLTYWLARMGAEVFGLSLEPESRLGTFCTLKVDDLCKSRIADVRDSEAL